MAYMELSLLVMGIVLLVVGYRANRRNMLLSAAIVLFLSGALGSFAQGYVHGWHQAGVSARAAAGS
jgi:disulfide bond formation protein DsbB